MTGSIQKKGKCYYIVFRSYDPATGKKRQRWVKAGKTRKEADRKLSEIMPDVHDGTYRDLKQETFRGFAKLWLDSYAKTKTKESTFKGYESIVNQELIPFFGDYQLTDISPALIQRYVARRLETVSKKTKRKIQPKTVVNEIVPLKEMLKHAVIWEYLKLNPAQYLQKPRVEKEEIEILTPDEVNLLLEHASPEYRVLLMAAILIGMRRGELLGLQWGDIDWNHKQIHVRRAYCSKARSLTTPKTKYSKRRIDMSPTLVQELKKHKLACPKGELDLVFTNSEGGFIDPDNFYNRGFLSALRRAKIRKVTFHALRHTNVSLRLDKGQPILYISRQIGHSSVKTTLDIYGHLMKDVNSEQAKKLDDILGFVEHSGNSSEAVRRLLEEGNKKGVAVYATP